MVWGVPIVWYLFLAGLGAGAYATSVVVAHTRPEAIALRRAGRLIAPAVVAVGLVLLMMDAEAGFKNPLRFFYLISNLDSVMAWGVIILSVFMVISLLTLALDFWGKRRVPRALEYCGLAAALATAAYTGVLLGVVQTFPLWNTAVLPVLFMVSAASTGIASVVLTGCFVGNNRARNTHLLERTRLALPCVEVVLVVALLAVVQANPVGNGAGAASVAAITTGSYAPLFWIGLVVVGLAFPIAISVDELRRGNTRGTASTKAIASADDAAGVANASDTAAASNTANSGTAIGLTAAAEAGVLIGGFILRFLVVMAALPLS